MFIIKQYRNRLKRFRELVTQQITRNSQRLLTLQAGHHNSLNVA